MKRLLLHLTTMLSIDAIRLLRNPQKCRQLYLQSVQEVKEFTTSTVCCIEESQLLSHEHDQLLQQFNGFCVVHKPIGWSSQDIVSKFKYLILSGLKSRLGFKQKLKIGHAGTLDPLAEGILVLGIGSATKKLAGYMSGSKGYRAIAKLGQATDTLDSSGKVVNEKDASFVTTALLQQHIPKFQGEIYQIPPMYSALNKNGERLYDLARQGIIVEREPRRVIVHNVQLVDTDLYAPPTMFSLEVECGGGVYIRSIISDLAESMGTVGHMTALVRTKSGQFTLDDCLKEKDWEFDKILEHIQRCTRTAGTGIITTVLL